MRTELIEETWDALGEGQSDFIATFYARFFERFPAYRRYFPEDLNRAHLEKMIQTMALLANLADAHEAILPHVQDVGMSHARFRLTHADLDNFKAVFLETLAERLGERWSEEAAEVWNAAFSLVLIPLMRDGMAAQH